MLVVWTRGNKQAKTKKRLLKENISDAIFEEKFQIVTQFEVDFETNMPCKPKMSVLTCTTDPKGNYLGKVDLDISQYTEGEFKIHKLQLRGMNDQLIDGAFIEVGLKGEAGKA